MNKLKYTYFLGLLVYGFGILGIFSPWKDWFVSMTPASLLLTLALLLWNQENKSTRYFKFAALAFILGLGSEIMGVNTGFPFGDYRYSEVLGPQIFNTPLLIGVNWLLITQCSNALAQHLAAGHSAGVQVFLGAVLPTLADVLIEPVAIKLNYWTWAQGDPPLQNYMGWFGVSFLIALAYRHWMGESRNAASHFILAIQIGFFLILSMGFWLFYQEI